MKIHIVSEEYKTLSWMENCICLKCAHGKLSVEHQDVMSFKELIAQIVNIVKKAQPLLVFLTTHTHTHIHSGAVPCGFIMTQTWQGQRIRRQPPLKTYFIPHNCTGRSGMPCRVLWEVPCHSWGRGSTVTYGPLMSLLWEGIGKLVNRHKTD